MSFRVGSSTDYYLPAKAGMSHAETQTTISGDIIPVIVPTPASPGTMRASAILANAKYVPTPASPGAHKASAILARLGGGYDHGDDSDGGKSTSSVNPPPGARSKKESLNRRPEEVGSPLKRRRVVANGPSSRVPTPSSNSSELSQPQAVSSSEKAFSVALSRLYPKNTLVEMGKEVVKIDSEINAFGEVQVASRKTGKTVVTAHVDELRPHFKTISQHDKYVLVLDDKNEGFYSLANLTKVPRKGEVEGNYVDFGGEAPVVGVSAAEKNLLELIPVRRKTVAAAREFLEKTLTVMKDVPWKPTEESAEVMGTYYYLPE